jgi:hypothetical protein
VEARVVNSTLCGDGDHRICQQEKAHRRGHLADRRPKLRHDAILKRETDFKTVTRRARLESGEVFVVLNV